MITLYHPALDTSADVCDDLPTPERKHLRTLRVHTGDSIRLSNGRGRAQIGVLTQFDATNCVIDQLEPTPSNEPLFERILLLGRVSQERLEWAITSLTPLGLTRIIIIETEYAQPHTIRKERLEKLAETAMKQCHRARLPIIELHIEQTKGVDWKLIQSVVDSHPPETICIVGEPTAAPIASIHPLPGSDAIVAIGPEGGFTDDEVEKFHQHGFRKVSLGDRILRTELAAVAVFAHLL